MVSRGRMWRILGAVGFAGAGLLAAVAPGTAAVAAPASSVHNVSIHSGGTGCSFFCFKPKGIKILSGDSVKWTNNTGAPHTVTRCVMPACPVNGGTGTDPGPNSLTVNPGGTYQLAFTGKGTYVYYCTIHGYAVMHAKVTVK